MRSVHQPFKVSVSLLVTKYELYSDIWLATFKKPFLKLATLVRILSSLCSYQVVIYINTKRS